MTASAARSAPPLALTMGEPAGVGGEIALDAWRRRAENDPRSSRSTIRGACGASRPTSAGPSRSRRWRPAERGDPDDLPALSRSATPSPPAPAARSRQRAGDPRQHRRAVALARRGVPAVVTNPIHKATLYRAGFRHPGHTEFLAELDRHRTR